MIEVVAATLMELGPFKEAANLAGSMRRLEHDKRIHWRIAVGNQRGLPEVYNERLEATGQDIIVFTHDDVWIDDIFLVERLQEALDRYDVIGVAGSRRRRPGQASWHFYDDKLVPIASGISGAVAHGPLQASAVSRYGPVPAECELLDGVFLAAKVKRLRENAVRFDPRFSFHFYDMDFCRTARAANLRLGTWPISLTHSSVGDFTSQDWREGLAIYRGKWPD